MAPTDLKARVHGLGPTGEIITGGGRGLSEESVRYYMHPFVFDGDGERVSDGAGEGEGEAEGAGEGGGGSFGGGMSLGGVVSLGGGSSRLVEVPPHHVFLRAGTVTLRAVFDPMDALWLADDSLDPQGLLSTRNYFPSFTEIKLVVVPPPPALTLWWADPSPITYGTQPSPTTPHQLT